MKTLIEIVGCGILAVVFYGGLLMISSKLHDLHSIAEDRRNEKIRPMLDIHGHPLSDRKEDFYKARAEYERDFKTVDYTGVAMIVMFLMLVGLITGFFLK